MRRRSRRREQPARRSRDQHAGATPPAELHGLREHAHAAASGGPVPLAGAVDSDRPAGSDAADLGARQSVRTLRAGHDNPVALAVRLVAPGGTNVGSRPTTMAALIL